MIFWGFKGIGLFGILVICWWGSRDYLGLEIASEPVGMWVTLSGECFLQNDKSIEPKNSRTESAGLELSSTNISTNQVEFKSIQMPVSANFKLLAKK